MNACAEVKIISEYILYWMSKQPSVKEETITDWVLFQMSEKVHQIIYRSFSRHEEARTTGADWEWWFLFPNNFSYKLRIQAKKIFPSNYAHLAHSNQYGMQIEMLLNDALLTNSIPLYAFYTSKSGNVMCGKNINNEGVFISGANNIYDTFIINNKRKISPQDILKISNPISCFFCCPLLTSSHEGFAAYLDKYFSFENIKKIEKNLDKESLEKDQGKKSFKDLNILGLHRELPNYIAHALKREQADEYFENEFRHKIYKTDALLICDFR